MKKMVYPDKEPMVIIRTCTKAICCQNSPATKLLAVLLYWYDRSDCEDSTYTVGRTQEQLVSDACNELTVRTLHDVAAPMLEALGYIDIVTNESGKVFYSILIDKVKEALEAYKHGTLNSFLQASLDDKIEKFLIQIDPKEIEKFPSELEKFLFILEKFLIPIRKSSNSQRGRKPKSEEALQAKPKPPRDYRDKSRDRTRENSAAKAASPSQSSKQPQKQEEENTQPPLLDTPLVEPHMNGRWDAELVVQYTEFRNGNRYVPKLREAQLAAAKWLHSQDKALTSEQYKLAFDERFDPWWIEHKKKLDVTDMKAKEQSSGVIRLYAMLGKIEANKNRPNLRVVSSNQDFTSKTLNVERNEQRLQEMLEKSKKLQAERAAKAL